MGGFYCNSGQYKLSLKSRSYLAAKVWNAIPDSLRTNSNSKVFKNNLKDIDLVKFI